MYVPSGNCPHTPGKSSAEWRKILRIPTNQDFPLDQALIVPISKVIGASRCDLEKMRQTESGSRCLTFSVAKFLYDPLILHSN